MGKLSQKIYGCVQLAEFDKVFLLHGTSPACGSLVAVVPGTQYAKRWSLVQSTLLQIFLLLLLTL